MVYRIRRRHKPVLPGRMPGETKGSRWNSDADAPL